MEIIIGIIGAVASAGAFLLGKNSSKKDAKEAELKAKSIIDNAEAKASATLSGSEAKAKILIKEAEVKNETIKQSKILEAKERYLKMKQEHEKAVL